MLAIGGILRDSLDDICSMWERALAILEEHDKKMEPYKNIELSDQDAAKDILTALSPEKASALIAALTDVSKLTQSLPQEDAVKQLAQVNENMAGLQNIRDNLHKALDGVVP